MQLSVMGARPAALIAPDRTAWALSGDQLSVDLDISLANLPAGTLPGVGTAVIAVTVEPHARCKAFAERYGVALLRPEPQC